MDDTAQQTAAPTLTTEQRMQRLEQHATVYSDLVLRQRYADAKAYIDLFCGALHPLELLCIQQAGALAEAVRAHASASRPASQHRPATPKSATSF